MAKPTFFPTRFDGFRFDAAVEYTPLIYIVGTVVHRLALHRTLTNYALPKQKQGWQVSDPVSGACLVRDVGGVYKGMPTSSTGITLREARANAIASLDALIERVGSDAFNAKLADAAKQYA